MQKWECSGGCLSRLRVSAENVSSGDGRLSFKAPNFRNLAQRDLASGALCMVSLMCLFFDASSIFYILLRSCDRQEELLEFGRV